MVHVMRIFDVMRSIDPAATTLAAIQPVDDDPTARLIIDFRKSIAAMKCAMSDRLVRLGISMAQLNILYTLQRNGEMPMSRLADVLNVSLSNATGLVDRMEERGLIERTRVAEDRRIVQVHITDDGVRVLEANDALTDELLRSVLADLDRPTLDVMARTMGEFRAALEATVGLPTWDRQTGSTSAPRSR
jgi:DNA-binding MarR family transcriptional regulator